MRRLTRAFIMGALLFPLLDAMHTHAGVLTYEHPVLLRMAWWVPLEFGAMWAFISFALPQLEQWVAAPERDDTPTPVALGETAWFASVYAATALLATRPWLLASLLTLALLVRAAVVHARGDAAFVVASALLGPIGESVVSATGAFHYARPELGWVPAWLPLLWAHGGFFARRVFRHRAFAQALSTPSERLRT